MIDKMKICIFGLIGSGKTSVLRYLQNNYMIKIINLDEISKEIINKQEVIKFVKNNFPLSTIGVDERINRSIFRKLLFFDFQLNKKFSNFFWPLLTERLNEIILNYSLTDNIVVEGAILPLLNISFDKKIKIISKEQNNIQRILTRDNRPQKEIESIIKIQKQFLKNIDYDENIFNNRTISELYKSVDLLMQKYQITKLKNS